MLLRLELESVLKPELELESVLKPELELESVLKPELELEWVKLSYSFSYLALIFIYYLEKEVSK
jgi:hypothetical protein